MAAANLMPDVALDIGQGDAYSSQAGIWMARRLRPGTRGTADAVPLILRIVRQVEIEYMLTSLNVQPREAHRWAINTSMSRC